MSSSSLEHVDMDLECDVSDSGSDSGRSTISFTPSVEETLFERRGGYTYLTNEELAYWHPVDRLHQEAEVAFDKLKMSVWGRYPSEAADLIETLVVQPGSVVLDIGAGRLSLWAIAISHIFGEAEVISVDLLPTIDCFVPPNLFLEIFDMQTGIPYPSDYFSLVSHSGFACWLKDMSYPALVDEIARVLKRGAVYLAIEPATEWVPEDGSPLALRFPSIATYLLLYQSLADVKGNGSLSFSQLNFGATVASSGSFGLVDQKVFDLRLGGGSGNDQLDAAGLQALAIAQATWRSWVPLESGWSKDDSVELERTVGEELESLKERKRGEGLVGKISCLWAVRDLEEEEVEGDEEGMVIEG